VGAQRLLVASRVEPAAASSSGELRGERPLNHTSSVGQPGTSRKPLLGWHTSSTHESCGGQLTSTRDGRGHAAVSLGKRVAQSFAATLGGLHCKGTAGDHDAIDSGDVTCAQVGGRQRILWSGERTRLG